MRIGNENIGADFFSLQIPWFSYICIESLSRLDGWRLISLSRDSLLWGRENATQDW